MLTRKASPAEKRRKASAQSAIRRSIRSATLAGSRGSTCSATLSGSRATSIRLDKSFGQPHRFGVGKRQIHIVETVGSGADRLPRNRRVVPGEDSNRADEMSDLAS